MKLIGMLSRLEPVNVLVIGDFMQDAYTHGKVNRISPEAPVSVLQAISEESRPGGAGNVVLNLSSLGAKVSVIGRVGHDFAGDEIRALLENEDVDVQGLVSQTSYKTPVKNRFIANSQQVLRVDYETHAPLSEDLQQEVLQILPKLMDECQIIAISDYGKGFLSNTLLEKIMEMALTRMIPVIVDPKGIDFNKYRGATILKPNLSEAYAAARLSHECPLNDVAVNILKTSEIEKLMITRSHEGISIFEKQGNRYDFPVRSKEVKDVTGAGDTVLSMLCVAFANGLGIKDAAQLANIAAGIAIERIGCARINLADIAERVMELDVDNKVFDGKHISVLQQALKEKRCCLLSLESSHGMSTAVFRSLHKLAAKTQDDKLVIYLRDLGPDEEFISMLTSVSDIDFIVIDCPNFKELCDQIAPTEIYAIESSKLIDLNQPHAQLASV